MKAFYLILVVLLFSEIDTKCDGTKASSVSDCKNIEVSSGYYKCCYEKGSYSLLGEKVEVKECISVTKNQYEYIDTIIDASEEMIEALGGKDVKLSIDCSSKSLVLSLLSLSLLLLL